MYEETGRFDPPEEGLPPDVISTSQAINLTTTLASASLLFSIFLLFADQRSRAVRRYAVQSVGLGVLHVAVALLCWIVSLLIGWAPLIGALVRLILRLVLLAFSALALVLRVRMMYSAYRGVAWVLPLIGPRLRRFE